MQKDDFLSVIDYYLCHKNIIFICSKHNLFNHNLFHGNTFWLPTFSCLFKSWVYKKVNISLTTILYSYKNPNFEYYFLKHFWKLQACLGGKEVLSVYQEPLKQNYHFWNINHNKKYLINQIDLQFKGEKLMFSINEKNLLFTNLMNCMNPSTTTFYRPNKIFLFHFSLIFIKDTIQPSSIFWICNWSFFVVLILERIFQIWYQIQKTWMKQSETLFILANKLYSTSLKVVKSK